jgi:hypothetical protein
VVVTRWRFRWLPARGDLTARDVDSVAALRAMHRWAQRQQLRGRVDDWDWWVLWRPDPLYAMCPYCGWHYLPGCIRDDLCRCGLVHTRYECRYATGHTHDVPARHDGCAPLPYDPGAYRAPRRLQHRR